MLKYRLFKFFFFTALITTLLNTITIPQVFGAWSRFGGGNAVWATDALVSCLDGFVVTIGRTLNDGTGTFTATDGGGNLLEANTIPLVTQAVPIYLNDEPFNYYNYEVVNYTTPFNAATTVSLALQATTTNDGVFNFAQANVPVEDCNLNSTIRPISSWDIHPGNGLTNRPRSVATDSAGNFYVATGVLSNDTNRPFLIQKFDSNGNFLMQFGTPGTGNGEFQFIEDMAFDSNDNLYVVDNLEGSGTPSSRVQKFDSNGNYLTQWGSQGTNDGQFDTPKQIAVDTNDNVYVADEGNDRVQVFDANGTHVRNVSTGGGSNPYAIALDSSNNLYVGNSSETILQYDSSGTATVVNWGGFGSGDGQFNTITSMAVDSLNRIFVADETLDRIQIFTNTGSYVDKWGTNGSGDGQFDQVVDIAITSSDRVYAADNLNSRVQRFSTAGAFSAAYGTTINGARQFQSPTGVAAYGSDTVYIADSTNNRVQKLNNLGQFVSEVGSVGSGDGQFNNPQAVAVNNLGQLYVVDTGNNRIQRFDASGNYIGQWGYPWPRQRTVQQPTGNCNRFFGQRVCSRYGQQPDSEVRQQRELSAPMGIARRW